ncbi:probable serine/threonine-protein kinase At1g09600 isoform X4 [Asparagus officinalis]|uniref:probable serine/threonine-protein kinase At1g09600 isoform X4 n=1 Tax=Asparagus officinalis TaxID=4686 RepID=UPI00098E609A|nr:probable serine/threonine-protein kinase At1g09600 isoform X4 [Asparagus officinalis]
MGCICSKGINKDEILADIESTKSSRQVATPSKEVEGSTPDVEANPVHRAAPPRSLSKRVLDIVSVPVVAAITRVANGHQRNVTVNAEELNSRNGEVANGVSTEYVIAGWPSWLTSVAAEAIKGWLPRRAESFEKLDKIGQGTYSSVYRARDLETGKIVALKKVRFVNMDPESVRFMAREIHILRKLDHPNVIKLEGIVTSRVSCSLYLVFEYMEHDLAGLIATPGIKFTEPQVKCFMQQLLSGLDHCHSRGVLHRDIKGSNLLIDSNGVLKIGDFGLASVFGPAKKQPMTSRVVTLWYRPPELLLGATVYGVAVDLWSSGCILAELFAGKPIFPGRNEFFTTEPLACDPSSLPKYPPSKEYDAKLRDQESRRQKAASKVGTAEAGGRGDSQAQQPQDYSTGVQKKQANINYSRENYNLAIEPPSEDGYRHAGSTMHPGAYGNSRSKNPKNGDHRNFPGRSVSTLKTNNGAQLRTQRSYITQHGDAGDLASFAGVSRNTAGSRYNRPASSHRKNDREGKDFTVDYGIKNKRIHNSGPLMGAGGNMDNMLKEHERQIQQAVRKACLDNKKT